MYKYAKDEFLTENDENKKKMVIDAISPGSSTSLRQGSAKGGVFPGFEPYSRLRSGFRVGFRGEFEIRGGFSVQNQIFLRVENFRAGSLGSMPNPDSKIIFKLNINYFINFKNFRPPSNSRDCWCQMARFGRDGISGNIKIFSNRRKNF